MPGKKISDERVLSAFVDKMITDKNALVAESDRTALYRILRERVDAQIEQAMLTALSDDQLIELNRMLDEGASDDEIEDLFNNSGADFAGAVEKTLTMIRDDYLENGDNAALIEQSKAEYAEFLAMAPDGQGESIGMGPGAEVNESGKEMA